MNSCLVLTKGNFVEMFLETVCTGFCNCIIEMQGTSRYWFNLSSLGNVWPLPSNSAPLKAVNTKLPNKEIESVCVYSLWKMMLGGKSIITHILFLGFSCIFNNLISGTFLISLVLAELPLVIGSWRQWRIQLKLMVPFHGFSFGHHPVFTSRMDWPHCYVPNMPDIAEEGCHHYVK